MTATEIDATIYALYPRKVGRVAALKAIARAAKVVQVERKCDPTEARRFLYAATRAYARSPAGNNPDRSLIPHPTTFFNQGRYFDDPKEWQLGGSNGQQQHRKEERVSAAAERGNKSRDGIREALARRLGCAVSDLDGRDAGELAEAGASRGHAGDVAGAVGGDRGPLWDGDVQGVVIDSATGAVDA